MSAAIRPVQLEDAPDLARLWSAAYLNQWPVTAEDLRERYGREQTAPPPGVFRLVAEENGVKAALNASPFAGTDQGLRVQFAGEQSHFTGLLLEALVRAPRDTRQLLSVVREDHHPQRSFLEAAGFRNAYQSWGAHLDLRAFDFTPFAALEERQFLRGVEVQRYAAAPPEHAAALRALHDEGAQDAPRTPVTSGGSFEAVTSGTLFVALKKGEPLAYTSLQPDGQDALETGHTATRWDERGQGLALLVKATALRWAREQGYARASTGGSVANLPMLRVNQQLGYRAEPMWLTFVLELSTNATSS